MMHALHISRGLLIERGDRAQLGIFTSTFTRAAEQRERYGCGEQGAMRDVWIVSIRHSGPYVISGLLIGSMKWPANLHTWRCFLRERARKKAARMGQFFGQTTARALAPPKIAALFVRLVWGWARVVKLHMQLHLHLRGEFCFLRRLTSQRDAVERCLTAQPVYAHMIGRRCASAGEAG